jgi:transcriptional regulator with XRE-family HTH domain
MIKDMRRGGPEVRSGMIDSSIIMDEISIIMDDINTRIAARVRELRGELGVSLDALADACGVSRSMISLIERGESSPTAVVLEKLATGLGVPLAALFDQPAAPADPVSRRKDQAEWRDPASGYVRRNVSPAGFASPIHLVEVSFPPGARVAYETAARPGVTHQQIWVLQGALEVTLGRTRHRLDAGDCLAMVLDQPITFRNRTDKPARYAVVICQEPFAWPRP